MNLMSLSFGGICPTNKVKKRPGLDEAKESSPFPTPVLTGSGSRVLCAIAESQAFTAPKASAYYGREISKL
jgi:hypothetical protein